jgi:hypothetical protein
MLRGFRAQSPRFFNSRIEPASRWIDSIGSGLRVGLAGRVGVTSLYAIDAGFYGALDNWIAAADAVRAGP